MKQKSDFRRLHEQESCFLIPNPWDAGTARILASLGYSALVTTSARIAFAMGQRDGWVSQKLKLAHCRDLVAATTLPVSADLEKGFGDSPESCAQTIQASAATGLAGGSIEDIPAKNWILFIRLIWRLRVLARPVQPATR